MALYQPTHIIPSSFSGQGNGVVSVNDPMLISWQLNGNSKISGFQIVIRENTTEAPTVFDSGRVVLQEANQLYAKDRYGNPQIFTYGSVGSWATMSTGGISDGNSYTIQITQYWINSAGVEESVVQIAHSVFVTRQTPTLSFLNFQTSVRSITETFQAIFSQAQGDAIDWSRWQVASVDSSGNRTVIEDTGVVYTGDLVYTVDGLFSGETYAILCEVQTQNGVVVQTGWQTFTVSYEQNVQEGEMEAGITSDGAAVLLKIEDEASYIIGESTPDASYSFEGNRLVLESGSVTWDQEFNSTPMSLKSPNTLVWHGDVTGLQEQASYILDSPMLFSTYYVENDVAKYIYLITENNTLYVFSVSEQNLLTLIQRKETTLQSTPSSICVSPNGSILILTVSYTSEGSGGVYQFPVAADGSLGTGSILALGENPLVMGAEYARFSPDGDYLVVGGYIDSDIGTFLYSVNGTTLTFVYNIEINGENVKSMSADFSPSGDMLAVGVYGTVSYGVCLVYSIDRTSNTLAILGAIEAQGSGDPPVRTIGYNVLFGKLGSRLYVGGLAGDTDVMSAYTVNPSSATPLTLFGDIPSGLNRNPNTWAFDQTYTLLFDGNTVYQEMQTGAEALEPLFDVDTNAPNGMIYATAMSTPSRPSYLGFLIGGSSTLVCYFKYIRSALLLDVVGSDAGNGFYIQNNGLSLLVTLKDTASVSTFPIRGNFACIAVSPYSISCYFLTAETEPLGYTRQRVTLDTPLSVEISSLTLSSFSKTSYILVKQDSYAPSGDRFAPVMDSKTLFFTQFANNTLNASSYYEAIIYRSDNGATLKNLYSMNKLSYLKDYGVRSNQSYSYQLVRTQNGEFDSVSFQSDSLCQRFGSFYLMEATEDETLPKVYHVLHCWRFGNNVSVGGVSNNNSPSWLTNFTPYRLRQPISVCGKSGTLQALLRNVKRGKYQDRADQMDELYALSTSKNPLFLKDPKGNLYMVHTSAPIVQTVDLSTYEMQVTVSIPWEEIGDATGVSLIQTPFDEGWQSNEVENVTFDVDVETGMLIVTYPTDYVGTRFKIEGDQLVGMTPFDIPEQELSIVDGVIYVEAGGQAG